MKKVLSLVLAIVLCVSIGSISVFAASTTTIKGERASATLTGVIGEKEVTIRESVLNYETYEVIDYKYVPTKVYVIAESGSEITMSVDVADVELYPGLGVYSPYGGYYASSDEEGGQFTGALWQGWSQTESLEKNDYYSHHANDTVYGIFIDEDVQVWFTYDNAASGSVSKDEPSDWAKAEVEAASAAGLVTDHTSSGFKEDITRFQFAELIVNLAEKVTGKEITPAAADTFTDCSDTAVLKAYATGIVNGVGDNKFAPDTTTNREQLATMISRAIAYIEKETGKTFAPAAPSIEKFSDKGDVSSWAVEGVGLLAANGIMSGTSETTCSPQNSCTIEQSILFVYRFFNQTL